MADIAFLLICFFMVTAVFAMNRGLDFSLPEDVEPGDREEAVHIRITNGGQICVDGKAMEASGILPYLEPKLRRWPEKPILVQTESQAPYGAFIAVYDQLRQASLPRAQGGLGRRDPLNISIPSLREIRELEAFYGDLFAPEGSGC
jgi:biopolymer transport protein ExbD